MSNANKVNILSKEEQIDTLHCIKVSGLADDSNVLFKTEGDLTMDADNVNVSNGLQSSDLTEWKARILNTDTEILKDVYKENFFMKFDATGGGEPLLDLDSQLENGLVATFLFTADATSKVIVRAIDGTGSPPTTNKFVGLTDPDDPSKLSESITGYVIGDGTGTASKALMRFTNFDNGVGTTNEFMVEIIGYDGILTIS